MIETADFGKLSPHDFELVMRDVCRFRFDAEFEAFGAGRDGGIDLRNVDGGETVVQCKHYLGSTAADLRRAVKQEESKILKLEPDHYILATSRALSPQFQDELSGLIDGWAEQTDVWGGQRVIGYIDDSASILEKHPKLWMPSHTVLRKLLNVATFTRTDEFLIQAMDDLKTFVSSEARNKATEILAAERVLVITGDPGIGKTTLAKSLALDAASREFEVVLLMDSVEEGQALLDSSRPQLFVFDDFLGQTKLLDVTRRNESSDLSLFCESIRRTEKSRFVMTSRDYILNAAVLRDSRLRTLAEDVARITLELKSYSENIRATILYNHLHFSEVPREALHHFVRTRTYREVVKHRYYNPRLIKDIVSQAQDRSIAPEEFPDFFRASINNPSELWSDAFRHHLDTAERAILIALLVCPRFCDLALVRDIWPRLLKHMNAGVPSSSIELTAALRVLEPTFIRILARDDGQFISFANPGVLDVVSRLVADAPDLTRAALAGVVQPGQLERLSEWTSPLGMPASYLDVSGLREEVEEAVSRVLDGLLPDADDEAHLLAAASIARRVGSSDLSTRIATALADLCEAVPLDRIGDLASEAAKVLSGADSRRVGDVAVGRLFEADMSLEVLRESMKVYDAYPQIVHGTGMAEQFAPSAGELLGELLQGAAEGEAEYGVVEELSAIADWLEVELDEDLMQAAEQAYAQPEPDYDEDRWNRHDVEDAELTDIDLLFESL